MPAQSAAASRRGAQRSAAADGSLFQSSQVTCLCFSSGPSQSWCLADPSLIARAGRDFPNQRDKRTIPAPRRSDIRERRAPNSPSAVSKLSMPRSTHGAWLPRRGPRGGWRHRHSIPPERPALVEIIQHRCVTARQPATVNHVAERRVATRRTNFAARKRDENPAPPGRAPRRKSSASSAVLPPPMHFSAGEQMPDGERLAHGAQQLLQHLERQTRADCSACRHRHRST